MLMVLTQKTNMGIQASVVSLTFLYNDDESRHSRPDFHRDKLQRESISS